MFFLTFSYLLVLKLGILNFTNSAECKLNAKVMDNAGINYTHRIQTQHRHKHIYVQTASFLGLPLHLEIMGRILQLSIHLFRILAV